MKIAVWLVIFLTMVFSAFGLWQNKKWDMRTRFTVVDPEIPVKIESFDPATKEGIILILPDNLMIDSVGGKGSWRAGVIKKAGERWGMAWVADSVTDYLGITYTGIKNEMGPVDKILWKMNSGSIKWKTVELDKSSLLVEVKDPDGEVLTRLDERWPENAAKWFGSFDLATEQINVTIINATGVPGLGAHISRKLENSGIRVVAVGNSNSEKNIDKCLLEGDKTTGSGFTGQWLDEVFKCDWVQVEGKEKELTLTLGSEYKLWWQGD